MSLDAATASASSRVSAGSPGGFLSQRHSTDLSKYNPEKGLKTVAIAEVAERHARRAKDATRLLKAVELKLTEQRKFVLWWDGQGLNKAGSPILTDRKGLMAGRDGIPDSVTVHRWRMRLKDERKFDLTLSDAQARCVKVCEARQGQSDYAKATNTGETEWYTPAKYIKLARVVLGGIDLDPASTQYGQRVVKAAKFYSKDEDGLAHSWPGRVWLNPPYTQPDIAQFVTKLLKEYTAKRTRAAILLTHNSTDTTWFHQAANVCAALCFTRGRIAFLDRHGEPASPTQGQAFFYFGNKPQVFRKHFELVGLLVRRG